VTAYRAVAQLRQHIRRDARIHGVITHGGAAPNIVPDYTAGKFYIRAQHPKYLQELRERLQACFEAGALAARCELVVGWGKYPVYQPMRTNRAMAETYRRNGEALGRQFLDLKNISTGSSDMGNVSQVVPAIHPTFGVGQMVFNHTPEFTAVAVTESAHASMLQPAKALAMTGVELALDPDLVRRAKAEFAGAR